MRKEKITDYASRITRKYRSYLILDPKVILRAGIFRFQPLVSKLVNSVNLMRCSQLYLFQRIQMILQRANLFIYISR